jgi:hypothetical protein
VRPQGLGKLKQFDDFIGNGENNLISVMEMRIFVFTATGETYLQVT